MHACIHKQLGKKSKGNISLLLTLQHVPVGVVGDGVDVGRHFRPPLALVHFHHLVGVDGESPVRIHCHTEEAGVGLDRGDNR